MKCYVPEQRYCVTLQQLIFPADPPSYIGNRAYWLAGCVDDQIPVKKSDIFSTAAFSDHTIPDKKLTLTAI